MTDPSANLPTESAPESAPEAPAGDGGQAARPPAAPETPTPADGQAPPGNMPDYKGEPLDSDRGPGLGCFWIQIGLLTFFLVFTPLTVTWGWDPFISGALLIFTLILLLFSGQTIIFLLRLVAADRRARRTPLSPTAKPTVGQMEEAAPAEVAPAEEAAAPDKAEPTDDEQAHG